MPPFYLHQLIFPKLRMRSVLILLASIAMVAAWLAPNHYPPWGSFYSESCMVLSLLFLIGASQKSFWKQGVTTLACTAALTALIPWVQYALGQVSFSSDAWVSSAYLIGFAIAIWTGHAWGKVDAKELAQLLSWCFLVGSIVSAGLALTQAFDLRVFGLWVESSSSAVRVGANLGQPNNLATLIGFGVVGLVYLKEIGQLGRLASSCCLVLLVWGASVTQSRTALVYGPLVVAALWWFGRRGVVFRTRVWTSGVWVLFHWGVATGMAMLQRDTLSLAEKGLTVSTRFAMWPLMLDASAQAPWWGYGWLQVGAAQMAVATKHPSSNELWLHAHNIFLELVIWCGYPLGLLLGGLLLYGFVSRVLKVRQLEASMGMVVASILGAHALMELPHHYAYFLIPLGLWLGLVEASIGSRVFGATRASLALIAVGVALTLALWRDYFAVEEDFRLMRFEAMGVMAVRAKQPAPDAPFLSSLTAFLRAARTEPAPHMAPETLAQMAQVIRRYPYAGSMIAYAKALTLNARLPEALEMCKLVRHVHGEDMYARLKFTIHQAVLDGQADLAPLDNGLPL
jgi:O-antigen ligase